MCRKNAISDVHPQVTEIMQKGKKKKSYFVMVVSHPMMQNIILLDKDAFRCDFVWSLDPITFILVSNIHIVKPKRTTNAQK